MFSAMTVSYVVNVPVTPPFRGVIGDSFDVFVPVRFEERIDPIEVCKHSGLSYVYGCSVCHCIIPVVRVVLVGS